MTNAKAFSYCRPDSDTIEEGHRSTLRVWWGHSETVFNTTVGHKL